MIRKITLLLLSLGFVLGGVVFALNELNLATGSSNQDHIYIALFGGGLLGFVGVVLFFAGIRKPAASCMRGLDRRSGWFAES